MQIHINEDEIRDIIKEHLKPKLRGTGFKIGMIHFDDTEGNFDVYVDVDDTYSTTEATPKENICNLIRSYGSIDGAHHKQWLLDQIAQIACKDYENLFNKNEDWDKGVAP